MSCEIPMGLRFSILHRSFRCRIDEMLREYDVTGAQFGVLNAIRKNELLGIESRQRDIENITHVTHPTMTEMIKRLEKKGLIAAKQSAADRRSKCITLTEEGSRILKRTAEIDNAVYNSLIEGLSAEQIQQLNEITEIMLKNIKCTKGNE